MPLQWFSEPGFLRLFSPASPTEIIYKLTFKTRHPTLNADNEIVIIKTVAIERPVAKRTRPGPFLMLPAPVRQRPEQEVAQEPGRRADGVDGAVPQGRGPARHEALVEFVRE